jgi:hypothetical protein
MAHDLWIPTHHGYPLRFIKKYMHDSRSAFFPVNVKVKIKFTIEQTTKAQRWRWGTLLFL